MNGYYFTSESVAAGHPDKVCDQISDAILDLFLAKDPEARVACETLATTNLVVLAGEVRSRVPVTDEEIRETVRLTIKEIGYEQEGFHHDTVEIINRLHEQSADIAQGVDAKEGQSEGAGDQGIMFGYATDETESLMPPAIHYAHCILKELDNLRRNDETGRIVLLPDAKSQVTLLYDNEGTVIGIDTIVVSTQHASGAFPGVVKALVEAAIINALPGDLVLDWHRNGKFFVNPTGKFEIGGPDGDTGLTGRKIIVDTYGGAAPHGGGAFSGKDPTKVDRSAAYIARYLAKNVVAAGLARKCTIQLSYAIGVPQPTSLFVDTHGTSLVAPADIADLLQRLVDLTPRGIRTRLGLNRPIYRSTAAYGHFGRDPGPGGEFSWEMTDLVTPLSQWLLANTTLAEV